jgi:hypothetical protein
MEIQEPIARALGITIQILEELPDDLRPDSNIADMREILAGNTTGRDSHIIVQAIATALAFRASNAMTIKRQNAARAMSGANNRWTEFGALFKLASQCDPSALALYFDQACDKVPTLAAPSERSDH